MLKNRMIYVAVLLILCLFRIAYTGYVAGMLLLMALILPIFSWLISLPGAIYTQVLLTVPDQVVRGGEATLTLTLRQSRLFATGAVRGKLRTTNALTGEVKKIKLKSVYDGFPLDTAHCCQYECSLKGLRISGSYGAVSHAGKKSRAGDGHHRPVSLGAAGAPGLVRGFSAHCPALLRRRQSL